MSSAALAPQKVNRPNIVAVGTIVWLSSELMFFAALFSIYFTTRSNQGPKLWLESTSILNVPFASINTTVLVLSSVTCQFGVFAAERFQAKRTGSLWKVSQWGMKEWFALTFLMGAFFVGGQ
ncbi:MAG: cytochrome c oxidase subunit 3, partial [Candidatus Nanopelagicaceae bacterium]